MRRRGKIGLAILALALAGGGAYVGMERPRPPLVIRVAAQQEEAVQAAVKDALRGTTPKAAGKPYEITKEQILNVKDTNERRRLMAENPELFIRR